MLDGISMVREGGQTTLYRFFDVNDQLLYVGIAGNPGRRFAQHEKDKHWWRRVARASMEHYGTRDEAARAEELAILTELPHYNVVGNPGLDDKEPVLLPSLLPARCLERLAELDERTGFQRLAYSLHHLAEVLGITMRDARLMIANRKVAYVKVGRAVIIRRDDLVAAATNHDAKA